MNYQLPTSYLDKKELNKLLVWAAQEGASDIFLETDDPIYIDLYGDSIAVTDRPLQQVEMINLVVELFQESGPSFLTDGTPLYFSHVVLLDDDSMLRFRVTVSGSMSKSSSSGIDITFRTFPDLPPSVEELGLESDLVNSLRNKDGIFLMTGPTGSGKSTTMASCIIDSAQKYPERIITFEDPVEFDLKAAPNLKAKITQSQIPTHMSSYKIAVENALRRSPKKVFFGEARSATVISDLVTIALTGHLVLTTLHTNSVELAIPRIVDLFPVDEQRAVAVQCIDAMRCICHQRLVKKPGGKGRTAIRSYLVFDDKTRLKILSEMKDVSMISQLVSQHLNESGLPLMRDVEQKWLSGNIDIHDYLVLLQSIGGKPDYEKLRAEIEMMLESGLLEASIGSAWLKDLQHD